MNLKDKIDQAKKIIKEASQKWTEKEIVIAWTGGKDSTVILHLIREIYGGQIPFRVMFNDSTEEFDEVLDFIKKLKKEWNIDLITIKHLPEDLKIYRESEHLKKRMEIMRIAKINVIDYAIDKYNIKAFVSGIRWDEHEARSHETIFSERPSHFRVHPILHFTLDDIWEYIRKFNVPYVDLYDKGYKSLGEKSFTHPVDDPNAPERAGREDTKEKLMNKLRELGYW